MSKKKSKRPKKQFVNPYANLQWRKDYFSPNEINISQKRLNFDQDVYVYYNTTNSCIKEHSNFIKSVTLTTFDSICKFKKYEIPAYYCNSCEKYFIDSTLLDNFVNRNEHPLFKYHIISPKQFRQAHSELWLLGYNVQKNVLSEVQRQNLLQYLIDNKLFSKSDIIKHLQNNINFSGQKNGNEEAREKWEKDIKFVSTL